MNQILNERGERVIAEGSATSPLRMLIKYPDTLATLIKDFPEVKIKLPIDDERHLMLAASFYKRLENKEKEVVYTDADFEKADLDYTRLMELNG